jgi:hypothetical protein
VVVGVILTIAPKEVAEEGDEDEAAVAAEGLVTDPRML